MRSHTILQEAGRCHPAELPAAGWQDMETEVQDAVLTVTNLGRSINGSFIHSGISFSIRSGEVLFVRGPSGVGKTLLLRSIAYLDPFEEGELRLNGKTPEELGIPRWRALVCHVHQSRVTFKGTPSELYFTVQQYKSQRARPRGDLPALVHDLGLEQGVLNQPWSQLSGGQAQRVQLAIALALKPAVILLDEPTSALDVESTRRVERVVKSCGAAVVWVSHDPDQPVRVGGRILSLPLGNESAVVSPPNSPDPPAKTATAARKAWAEGGSEGSA